MTILILIFMMELMVTSSKVMTAVFSAAIHDVDHPGLTNQYLINTSTFWLLLNLFKYFQNFCR